MFADAGRFVGRISTYTCGLSDFTHTPCTPKTPQKSATSRSVRSVGPRNHASRIGKLSPLLHSKLCKLYKLEVEKDSDLAHHTVLVMFDPSVLFIGVRNIEDTRLGL